MFAPIAALAIVLAITIRARSSASGGRSSTLVPVTKRASSPAMLSYFANSAAASLATAVPSKKRGFCVPHSRTALPKTKS